MKFATVERIINLEEIPGAKTIELASVLGWKIIVKKNIFKINDYCVYVPIDTLVDTTKPYFSHLKSSYIDSINILNICSQGLIIEINKIEKEGIEIKLEEDYDVSALIGVTKYTKDPKTIISEINMFPHTIILKTDEDNLQTKIKCLPELNGKNMYITKKMDGSSMTLIINNGAFTLCSRNKTIFKTLSFDAIPIINWTEKDMMCDYVKANKLHEKLMNLNTNIAIQGEFCSPKVNNNKIGLYENTFYVFNIKDLDTDKYFGLNQLQLWTISNNILLVPIILRNQICDDSWTLGKFQNLANDVKYNNDPGEGIVIRPTEPFRSIILQKSFSVKLINKDYKNHVK